MLTLGSHHLDAANDLSRRLLAAREVSLSPPHQRRSGNALLGARFFHGHAEGAGALPNLFEVRDHTGSVVALTQ